MSEHGRRWAETLRKSLAEAEPPQHMDSHAIVEGDLDDGAAGSATGRGFEPVMVGPTLSTTHAHEAEIAARLRNIYAEREAAAGSGSLLQIPRFYVDPVDHDPARQAVREIACARFFSKKTRDLLSSEGLSVLWQMLVSHSVIPRLGDHGRPVGGDTAAAAAAAATTSGGGGGGGGVDRLMLDASFTSADSSVLSFEGPAGNLAEGRPVTEDDDLAMARISWESFSEIGRRMPISCMDFFRPETFCQFERDRSGTISTYAFFSFVMRSLTLSQTRVELSGYDRTGSGFLSESEVELYITHHISAMPLLASMDASFYPFYLCTAVRKFIFFLDPMRLGRVSIRDLLVSESLSEFLELRDDQLAVEVEEDNWFSLHSAFSVYSEYLLLDEDQNGMLSRAELAKFESGNMTAAFLDRVFEECHTYEGEVDYKTFLDFVLAVDNKATPQALHFFFRLLDLEHRGAINAFVINYFFKDVLAAMARNGQELVAVEDVKDEIFDMVKPKDPLRITLDDLVRCGCGDTVVTILTNVQGFWEYDNREALVAEHDENMLLDDTRVF